VARRCVRSKNIVNEEVLTHWGLLQKKKMVRKERSADIGTPTF